jgi:hypothetical protein
MKKFIYLVFLLISTQLLYSQCNSWENFPEGKEKAVEQHVIYRDKIKYNKFSEAYPIWENLYKSVQIPYPNKKTHFLDGIKMSLHFASSDTANRIKWLGNVDKIYSDYFTCIGYDPTQKAWQAYQMFQNNWKLEESFKIMEGVIRCSTNSVPVMTISHISRLGVYFYQQKKCDGDRLLNIYKRLEEIVKDKSAGKDSLPVKNYWEDAMRQFSNVEEIFDCSWWKERYSNDTKDLDKLTNYRKNIFDKCGSEDSIYKEISKKIFEIKKNLVIEEELLILSKDTTTVWRRILALRNLQEYDTLYREKYLNEESELYSKLDMSEREWISDELRSTELYRWAFKLYQSGKLLTSRDFCRMASRWCPNWGDPYILIGILYIENLNVNSFDSRTAVWVAIDEWNKAIRMDKKSTEKANTYIKNYTKYLPTKTELFQRGIQEGSLITIGGWIKENTKAWGI